MREKFRGWSVMDGTAEGMGQPIAPGSPWCWVPGPPVPKGRPKFSRQGGQVRTRTPKRTQAWQALAVQHLRAARLGAWSWQGYRAHPGIPEAWPAPGAVAVGPVAVEVLAVFKRPKRLERRADPAGPIQHDKRPDADNLGKAALDALQQAGWLVDDGQVATLTCRKWWAPKSWEIGPGVRIVMQALAWAAPSRRPR